MRLGGEQQVGEVAEHVRADRLALEAAGEPGEELLVDRDREVVGPELRQALEERALARDRLLQARGHLACIDGTQELRQLLQRVGGRALRVRLARRLQLAAQLERCGQDVGAGAQPRRGELRRRARELRAQPVAATATDRGQLAGPGTEPEAVGGDRGCERLGHGGSRRAPDPIARALRPG